MHLQQHAQPPADRRHPVQLRDVTDRKNFELQLEESEERFRIFMNNAPTVSMIKDEEGRLVFVNANFERSFRVLSKDALGMTLENSFRTATGPNPKRTIASS